MEKRDGHEARLRVMELVTRGASGSHPRGGSTVTAKKGKKQAREASVGNAEEFRVNCRFPEKEKGKNIPYKRGNIDVTHE